jgi:cell division protease FtsH
MHSYSYFLSRLPVLLGGRAAESIIFGDITTGAHDDLNKATSLARSMVCEYGMSEKLGPLTFGKENGMVFLGRDIGEERHYSEETAQLIDSEIKRIIDEAYVAAKKTLTDNRDKLEMLAKRLLERETLEGNEVREMLGIPLESPSENGAVPAV